MPVDWLTNHLVIFTQRPMIAKCKTKDKENLDFCTRVKKALGSVSQMVKNGNRLVFDQDSSVKDTSYIQNKRSNEKIWLRQENGVYVLDLMVAPPQINNDRNADPHFHRQR